MQSDADHHSEETTLESYSMGSLAEEAAEVGEHRFLCEACRAKLAEADSYIRAMKRAVPELPEPEPSGWNLRLLLPAFAVCALMIAAAVVKFSPSVERPPATVTLFAMPGERHASAWAILTASSAPARSDRTASILFLPLGSGKHLGAPVWQRVLSIQTQPPAAMVPPQPRGRYFVRVSLPSGELLREYALERRGRD
jgi:hypothetical protein